MVDALELEAARVHDGPAWTIEADRGRAHVESGQTRNAPALAGTRPQLPTLLLGRPAGIKPSPRLTGSNKHSRARSTWKRPGRSPSWNAR